MLATYIFELNWAPHSWNQIRRDHQINFFSFCWRSLWEKCIQRDSWKIIWCTPFDQIMEHTDLQKNSRTKIFLWIFHIRVRGVARSGEIFVPEVFCLISCKTHTYHLYKAHWFALKGWKRISNFGNSRIVKAPGSVLCSKGKSWKLIPLFSKFRSNPHWVHIIINLQANPPPCDRARHWCCKSPPRQVEIFTMPFLAMLVRDFWTFGIQPSGKSESLVSGKFHFWFIKLYCIVYISMHWRLHWWRHFT